VGLERGPLSLASTIEESRSRNRDYSRRGSAALTTRHPSICKKLALTSPTSVGRSVGIIPSLIKTTELFRHTSCFRILILAIVFVGCKL
jgi:hypothetical protein